MTKAHDHKHFLDSCANVWLYVGEKFRARPATIIGVVVGAVLLVTILTYTLVENYSTKKQVDQVTAAFCNGPDDRINEERCQDLLRALLRNPDQESAQRLKEIVKGAP